MWPETRPAGARTASGAAPVRILGVDPGSRVTGYGVIEASPGRTRHVAHGTIRPAATALPERLLALFRELAALLAEQRPDEVAMEQVFVRRNVASALVLGQARGAALCAVGEAGLPLFEYTPARIKQSVAGAGRAEKPQVQRMVAMLLNLRPVPAADAADALACALCHAHSRTINRVLRGSDR